MLAKHTISVWGIAIFAAFLSYMPVAAPAADDATSYAEVTTDKLVARSTPAPDGEAVTQLVKGDMVPVIKVSDGWATLAWNKTAYVPESGIKLPSGDLKPKVMYEDLREAFITHARALDGTIQWLEVPRASGISVRYHWREYKDRDALVARAKDLARLYSVMTTGETGIEVEIVSGNSTWAKAFY